MTDVTPTPQQEDHAAIHEKLDKLQEDVDTLTTEARQNAAQRTDTKDLVKGNFFFMALLIMMQAFVLYLIFWAW
jgi:tetrahydromethanopterin S-methyltransferase subunit G